VSFDHVAKMERQARRNLSSTEIWEHRSIAVKDKQHVVTLMERQCKHMCGAQWLVKTRDILIQYMSSDRYSTIQGLAIGGPFLQNHKLVIDSKALVTWDGERVVDSAPASFANDLVSLRFSSAEDTFKHKGRPMSMEIELPDRVSLTVNVGAIGSGIFQHFLEVFVTMPRPTGDVDGLCGDCDGDFNDETQKRVEQRMIDGDFRVPRAQSLFDRELSHKALLLEESLEAQNSTEELDCLAGSQEEARSMCSLQLSENISWDFVDACAIDVCVGGAELINHTAAFVDQADAVLEAAVAKDDAEAPDAPVAVCHTCVPGDSCYLDVKWAMQVGIPSGRYEEKGWAPVVTESSCFEEVQEALRVWQTLTNFNMGDMRDQAIPKPCSNSSGPQTMHELTYCR